MAVRKLMPQGGLHIMIGAAPRPDVGIAHDVRLVKAALLYADHVTLCSTSTSVFMLGLQFRDVPFDEQLRALERVMETRAAPEELALFRAAVVDYRRLTTSKRRTREELLRCQQFRKGLSGEFAHLVTRTTDLASQAGTLGLMQALKSGLVHLHPLNADVSVEAMVDEYIGVVSRAVSTGAAYPLLDDSTGSLIEAMIRDGELRVSDGAQLRGRSARLAAMLFDRLPTFDVAPVDELLDVRRALDGPLSRFRRAMLTLADTLRVAPWDANFPAEAELLITRDIAPAVAEIEEAVRDNGLLAALLRAADRPARLSQGSVVGGALALLVSQAGALPPAVAASIFTAAGVGLAARAEYEKWRERQRATERHELYFYYRVARALTR